MMPTHEIPTHLHGDDRVVAGCTWSQVFTLGSGAGGAFWAWQMLALPQIAHAALCSFPVLIAVACAFWRPDGHGLVTWLGLLAAYTLTPRRIVWRREAANHELLTASTLPAVTGYDTATHVRAAQDTSRPAPARAPEHRVRVRPTGPSTASRGVPRLVPARRHGGLFTVLVGQRLLCLSTHHLRMAGKERGV